MRFKTRASSFHMNALLYASPPVHQKLVQQIFIGSLIIFESHCLSGRLTYKSTFLCKEDLIYYQYLKPHTPLLSVPPSSPRIRSRGNKNIISNGILGPVAENENIDLTCDTVGGKGYLFSIPFSKQNLRNYCASTLQLRK